MMQHGLFGTFDYDRDWLQPEEPAKEHDPEQYIFRGGHWINVGDEQHMERERYEDNACWRKRYIELCYDLGEIINEQHEKIISITNENRRLKRENWNFKQTKRRRK